MAKKTKQETKKATLYVADKSLIDSISKVNHPYLTDEQVECICSGEEFDFKKVLPSKYFEYLLNNRFLKKI